MSVLTSIAATAPGSFKTLVTLRSFKVCQTRLTSLETPLASPTRGTRLTLRSIHTRSTQRSIQTALTSLRLVEGCRRCDGCCELRLVDGCGILTGSERCDRCFRSEDPFFVRFAVTRRSATVRTGRSADVTCLVAVIALASSIGHPRILTDRAADHAATHLIRAARLAHFTDGHQVPHWAHEIPSWVRIARL